MTPRWFKFCIDDEGNVPGNRVSGYTLEEAVKNALDMITGEELPASEECVVHSREIRLKLLETTRGSIHTAYYYTGKCVPLDEPVIVKNDCENCCECCQARGHVYRYSYQVSVT